MIDLYYGDIIDLVDNIQGEIYEQTCGCEYYLIEVCFCSGMCVINFLDIQIWNSDDDMREYDEVKDEYEPLGDFLRREINNEIKKLSQIKL
jgi:hypothetical protein